MKAEYLNPVITASKFVLQQACGVETKMGKPLLTQTQYENEVFIVLMGVTGQLHGQVYMAMDTSVACNLASKMMMGMPVDSLNDMAKSALGELMNMMMGNTMTSFSEQGIVLDITPPTLFHGANLDLKIADSEMICIPIEFDNIQIELNVAIKEKQ